MTNSKNFNEEIELFLKQNFPQIQLHGGESTILEADKETGYVEINLSGACSGCGISPMTVEQIKKRMFQNLDKVQEIHVTTGEPIQDVTQPVSFKTNEKEESNVDINAPF